jgi:hypothetical protein
VATIGREGRLSLGSPAQGGSDLGGPSPGNRHEYGRVRSVGHHHPSAGELTGSTTSNESPSSAALTGPTPGSGPSCSSVAVVRSMERGGDPNSLAGRKDPGSRQAARPTTSARRLREVVGARRPPCIAPPTRGRCGNRTPQRTERRSRNRPARAARMQLAVVVVPPARRTSARMGRASSSARSAAGAAIPARQGGRRTGLTCRRRPRPRTRAHPTRLPSSPTGQTASGASSASSE